LAEWQAEHQVSHVVMEATGQYWKRVWDVLAERGFELMLVNARHVKMAPGRKSDVADAAWLAELLEHGLLRGSFLPPRAIRELRDLTRYRKRLVQAHTSEGQRIAKILEDAGIKLDSVVSQLLGVSGRAMLRALIAGQRDPSSSPSWPGAGCALRFPHWPPRWRAASLNTTRSSSDWSPSKR
jgi:transposase